MDLLLKYLVLLHSKLGLDLLNRGFLAMFPDAMLSRRIPPAEAEAETDAKSLITCKKEVTVGIGDSHVSDHAT